MDNAPIPHLGTGSRSAQEQVAPAAAPGMPLSDAARRALDEAAGRRAEVDRRAAEIGRTPEQNGRGGLDPVRYEDWEIGGRAVDF